MNREQYGFRDEDLSRRHRQWGADCPAVDIDLLMVEFGSHKPRALVEYKHFRALRNGIDLNRGSYPALRVLADAAQIPFFVVCYWRDIWVFKVWPANFRAMTFCEDDGTLMNELDYVSMLYRFRNFALPNHVARKLHTEIPDGEYDGTGFTEIA